MDERLPDLPKKGRGAVSNDAGRFEPLRRERTDDGWQGAATEPDDLPPLRTTVTIDTTRTVIARNKSPDVPFDRSINPYRGCEHGCIYCFARPTHAFLGLSPGLDFESRLFAKPDAPRLLAKELSAAGYQVQPIALGTNTDPYQPIERDYQIMRGILEVLRDFNHPVIITTKSALVVRDLDILVPMAEKRLAKVALSLTTLDPALARIMEPRAPRPEKRLEAIRALAAAGVPTAVMTAPMIPALNDSEMERILEAAAERGASGAGYVLLRLPLEIKDLFEQWLAAHFPDRASHVLSLIRDMRGGKLNDARFGHRFKGQGAYADLIKARFNLACARLGLGRRDWQPDCSLFKVPPRPGDQLSLL